MMGERAGATLSDLQCIKKVEFRPSNLLRRSNEASSILSLPTFPTFPNLTCFTPRSHKGGDLLNPPFLPLLLPPFRSFLPSFLPSFLARSRYGGVSERARHTYYTCNALKDYMSRCRPSFLPHELPDETTQIFTFCSFCSCCLWVSIIVNFIIKGVSKISSLLISMHVQTDMRLLCHTNKQTVSMSVVCSPAPDVMRSDKCCRFAHTLNRFVSRLSVHV